MSHNNLCLETRAWIDNTSGIEEGLTELGAKFKETAFIEDEFFADLTELDPEQHTFEHSKKAARLRILSVEGKDTTLIAQIREAPEEAVEQGFGLHDITTVKYEQTGNPEKTDSFLEEFRNMGFDSFVAKIKKVRDIYTLDRSEIYIDNIDGFSSAVEIKSCVEDISQAKEIKNKHIEVFNKLGIPQEDLIEKSHTHMIIDSYLKSKPDLKKEILEKKLDELVKEKEKLMLESEECYREGGDGWHDNARWDLLREKIDVTSIRISKLQEEILELGNYSTQ
jgi:predicted adenylyl cyclase CyaB